MISKKYPFLFLDRDGVINERLPGQYVKTKEDFVFMPGALQTFSQLAKRTTRIIIVTNQQGVGKEIMTYDELDQVHTHMQAQIEEHGGRVDAIYSCTELETDKSNCRKPSPAMGIWAKMRFPELDFARALMVGDSVSDILFGKHLGMKTVLFEGKLEEKNALSKLKPDYSIKNFAKIVDIL